MPTCSFWSSVPQHLITDHGAHAASMESSKLSRMDSIDDGQRPRKMRKGTHSCFECKRHRYAPAPLPVNSMLSSRRQASQSALHHSFEQWIIVRRMRIAWKRLCEPGLCRRASTAAEQQGQRSRPDRTVGGPGRVPDTQDRPTGCEHRRATEGRRSHVGEHHGRSPHPFVRVFARHAWTSRERTAPFAL